MRIACWLHLKLISGLPHLHLKGQFHEGQLHFLFDLHSSK
jgi:hypothetical protein